MRRKLGAACMLLGAALLAAALALFLWNRAEAKRAEASAGALLPVLLQQLPDAGEAVPDPYDPAMTQVEVQGYPCVGYLALPTLGLELPVLAEWDYQRLKIAPCRYAGSVKTGDLVLAAHNYAGHFGRLAELALGDEVLFTDMDGITHRYTVAALEQLAPGQVADMLAGEYALTLFTCTYSGQNRVTVRCVPA